MQAQQPDNLFSFDENFCYNIFTKLFLSVAGDRTHIGTYVGVSPPPASNENNFLFLTYPQF